MLPIVSCGVLPSQGPTVQGVPPRPACLTAVHSVLTTVSTTGRPRIIVARSIHPPAHEYDLARSKPGGISSTSPKAPMPFPGGHAYVPLDCGYAYVRIHHVNSSHPLSLIAC
jgi:hypothetical protein